MKHIIFTGTVLLASAMTGEAMANCTDNEVINLSGLLLNHTVCDANATYDTRPKHPELGVVTMGIQEEHLGGGDLYDYKQGEGHPIDPRGKVGTWRVTDNCTAVATVRYIYDQSGPATTEIPYKVYSTGSAGSGTYDFCTVGGSSPVASVKIISGTNVGCGSSATDAVPPCPAGIAGILNKDKKGNDKKGNDKKGNDKKGNDKKGKD